MTLGLGSGTTAAYAIKALGERIRLEGIDVRGVPTSSVSEDLAKGLGIPLVGFDTVSRIDMTIDGADEVDARLNLVKGGGGALVREKIVAQASDQLIIIVDERKLLDPLGKFPLPVAVVPFGWETTAKRLSALCPDMRLRLKGPDERDPYITDDGLYILDLAMGSIPDPAGAELAIKRVTGVVEVGLFVGLTTRLIVGSPDGSTREVAG
jgi:ribose 5-phosphate isomerase A